MFKRLDPFDVYVDPHSTDIMFRDASYIIIRKTYPKTQLANMLPKYKAKIMKSSTGEEANTNFSERDFIGVDSPLRRLLLSNLRR